MWISRSETLPSSTRATAPRPRLPRTPRSAPPGCTQDRLSLPAVLFLDPGNEFRIILARKPTRLGDMHQYQWGAGTLRNVDGNIDGLIRRWRSVHRCKNSFHDLQRDSNLVPLTGRQTSRSPESGEPGDTDARLVTRTLER